MTAGGYSSSKTWRLYSLYIDDGSPYADYSEEGMHGSSTILTGSMRFSQSDVSRFDSSITVHAKANTSHSSTSYMWDISIIVNYKDKAYSSTATLSSSTVDAGKQMTVTLNNENTSNVTHTVTWTFGSKSYSTNLSEGATTASYTLPLSWCNEIPNTTSGSGTVTVITKSGGNSIGTVYLPFTLNVPASVVPSTGKITVSILNPKWNLCVQNRSGVKLTASDFSGAYGSSISSYTFSGSANGSTTSNTQTVPTVQASGNVTFSVKAVDSRGRESASASVTLSVTPYSAPSFTSSTVAYRCNSAGESNEEGMYIGARVGATYSTCGGNNTLTVSCVYQKIGDSSWTTGKNPMALETVYIFGGGTIQTNYSYHVKFVQQDAFGLVEKTVDVSTTQYTMFFRRGGTGVGIGKACEHDYALEINPDWGIYYGDKNLAEQLAGNDARYLQLSGGTMAGPIKKAGQSVSWVRGRDGALICVNTGANNQYTPIWSSKTGSGSWDCGPYTGNLLHFSYIADTDYSAGTNRQTTDISFSPSGQIRCEAFAGNAIRFSSTQPTGTVAGQIWLKPKS